ncbi:Epsin-1, required for endocytosis and actin patch assembly [Phytophthora pseudosyringae]|uniref:Epsin-1, required for endocytosis and actin patch assembly n=1 Tax=Phytophthora pseudosyringae TaxID=221518 RepID=A0A8T1VSS2_9STRA|nr:Epsin-1, required for endocytosis and actin patch assembly [Phytophthora pseudosyringae]
MASGKFLQNTAFTTIIGLLLVAVIQAGYVDFFRDANFKAHLKTYKNVQTDICYSFKRDDLVDSVSSIWWSGLPEKMDNGRATMITFHTHKHCVGHHIAWRVDAQTKATILFPSDLKRAGVNDAISSFTVWYKRLPTERLDQGLDIANTTIDHASGSGSYAWTNDTVGYL